MRAHGPTPRTYLVIYLILVLLLVFTSVFAVMHLGKLGTFLALSVGLAKALLIVLYFMEVRYSSRVTWVFAGAGAFWLGILFVLTFSDYATRGWIPSVGR